MNYSDEALNLEAIETSAKDDEKKVTTVSLDVLDSCEVAQKTVYVVGRGKYELNCSHTRSGVIFHQQLAGGKRISIRPKLPVNDEGAFVAPKHGSHGVLIVELSENAQLKVEDGRYSFTIEPDFRVFIPKARYDAVVADIAAKGKKKSEDVTAKEIADALAPRR